MSTTKMGRAGNATELGIPTHVDVVVVGSGAAGLMASLTAAESGARVVVFESQQVLGGTTATSGGGTWVPNHGYSSSKLREHDSADLGRIYLMGEGRAESLDPELIDSFVSNARIMTRFVEKHTYLSWIPGTFPDYHSEIAGATSARALFPGPFPPDLLGTAADLVRPPKKSGISKMPIPFWVLGRLRGVWIAGYAMIGALLEANLRYGVELRTGARVVELVGSAEGVEGVVVLTDAGERVTVAAAAGVVLASGGFEHSSELTKEFLGDSFDVWTSPIGHDGDAVRMAKSAGAQLRHMDEAWWSPAYQVPGQTMDGVPIARLLQAERVLPHTIITGADGRRFANEAAPYNEFGRTMWTADRTGTRPNKAAWMIFDDYYRRKYGFFDTPPGGDLPESILSATTIEGLAKACGIEPAVLRSTVQAFNEDSAQGRDTLFRRGATVYDRYYGAFHPRLGSLAPDHFAPRSTAKARTLLANLVGPAGGRILAHVAKARRHDRVRQVLVPLLATVARPSLRSPVKSVLAPIDSPPYYAARIHASCLGTIGGPRTDGESRVLDGSGSVIPGLYAAGNAAAAPTGGFYGGSGATLSLCLTFGFLAGKDLARRLRAL